MLQNSSKYRWATKWSLYHTFFSSPSSMERTAALLATSTARVFTSSQILFTIRVACWADQQVFTEEFSGKTRARMDCNQVSSRWTGFRIIAISNARDAVLFSMYRGTKNNRSIDSASKFLVTCATIVSWSCGILIFASFKPGCAGSRISRSMRGFIVRFRATMIFIRPVEPIGMSEIWQTLIASQMGFTRE